MYGDHLQENARQEGDVDGVGIVVELWERAAGCALIFSHNSYNANDLQLERGIAHGPGDSLVTLLEGP